LWLVAGIALLTIVSFAGNRRAALRFATKDLHEHVFGKTSLAGRWISLACLVMAMTLLVLSIVDVRWGKVSRPIPQKGIEVMFVLDVSRSMLAEDVTPTRLDRAKQMIRDVIDEMSGDRIGLAVFAGEVNQVIPMTSHYDDFKQRLDEVGPENIVRGGSKLGDAITVAAEGYLTKTNEHKAMVLVTDGEDMESRPIEAAKKIHQDKGVTVFTIGLGDFDVGAKIPVRTRSGRSSFMTHDGETVVSKLNGDILSRVATETGGAYIPAGTKQVNMADVYHGYIASVEQQDFETATVDSYEARFAWFLAPAIVILVATVWTAKD
ncbi:MAG: VWA domain-containing protein, partial [Rubripirellula sp.]